MKANLILYNIGQIFSPHDYSRPLKGKEMATADIIENGYIAILDGKILKIGSGKPEDSLIDSNTKMVDIAGKVATPGFIDSHTHLVHGGSRENEFSMKLNGVDYLDILAAGGGILSTVKATREASFQELYDKARKSLDTMLIHGTTAVEAKSGYGLNLETELKQLEVANKLNEDYPMDIVSTFMGAHAIPPEYKQNPEGYVQFLIQEMIPTIAAKNLAEFCDIFCEHGIFDVDQTRRILQAAKDNNFLLKIHADEIVSLGGAELAAEMGAVSAEHLMAASDQGILDMASKNVICDLLPATTFSLMKDTYARARKMLSEDNAIALSTDYNPGSSPTENIQFAMQLGCFAMKLTPIEALNAITINAAYALNRGEKIGSFKEGKQADIVILDAPNIDYLFYHFAINHVKSVYKNGKLVVDERRVL